MLGMNESHMKPSAKHYINAEDEVTLPLMSSGRRGSWSQTIMLYATGTARDRGGALVLIGNGN